MSKINIANSIRTFLGMSAEATDAEVHEQLQASKDAKATQEEPQTAPAAETAPATKSEGETLASQIIGYVKDAQGPIISSLEKITARLEALEKKPSVSHTSGEAAPSEPQSKKRSWDNDPMNVTAKSIAPRRSFLPSKMNKRK